MALTQAVKFDLDDIRRWVENIARTDAIAVSDPQYGRVETMLLLITELTNRIERNLANTP